MIVTWIFEDPRLILITFLNTPIAANLPIGFLELTPLTGLIRWCVKAPLAYKRKKKPSLANGHVPAKVTKDSAGMDRDSHLLYSKLHLSVLQVLMMLQVHLTEKNLYGRLGLILFDHMVPLVEEINRLADELNPLNASQEIELSLDRLAQALQVAMASGALLCTRGGWSRAGRRASLGAGRAPPVRKKRGAPGQMLFAAAFKTSFLLVSTGRGRESQIAGASWCTRSGPGAPPSRVWIIMA